MSDKRRERAYLDAWLSASRLEVEAVTDAEAPDFLLHVGPAVFGVEVTEFVGATDGGAGGTRAQAALRARVVARAEELYRNAGGAPLDVNVAFRDEVALDKRAVEPLAQSLADFLRASVRRILRYDHPGVWRTAVDLNGARFLASILSVQAVRVPDESHACWAADAGGWLRHAGERDLRHTVAAKEGKLARYRAGAGDACAELWLLIVFDLYAAGDPVRAPRAPVEFAVATGFDRVVCYDRITGRVVDVPRVAPGAAP